MSKITRKSAKKTNIDDVLEAVHALSLHVDKRLTVVESDIKLVRTQMVTKDYLDDKLDNLRGELVMLTRKEDKKLVSLVDALYGKHVLSSIDRKHIIALEPFARRV